MVEMSVYDLLNGGVGADPLALLEGFKFSRPVISFGPIPVALYAALDEIAELDAATPYIAQTAADTDDLRYLFRRLNWAKEIDTAARNAPLMWNDDASKVDDTDLETMREVLEYHYADRL